MDRQQALADLRQAEIARAERAPNTHPEQLTDEDRAAMLAALDRVQRSLADSLQILSTLTR